MGQAKKDSFVLYTDYADKLRKLPDDQVGKVFLALFDYVKDGSMPDLEPAADMCFSFIVSQIQRDIEKYNAICEVRAKSGSKGGKKRQANAAAAKQSQANQANATLEKQSQANQADNEYEYEPDYDTEHEHDYENDLCVTATTAHTRESDNGGGMDDDEDEADEDDADKLYIVDKKYNVVMLSDNQINFLLNKDKITLDEYNYYVEKLGAFIAEKGAHVKNHFDTIRKWIEEDRRTGGSAKHDI